MDKPVKFKGNDGELTQQHCDELQKHIQSYLDGNQIEAELSVTFIPAERHPLVLLPPSVEVEVICTGQNSKTDAVLVSITLKSMIFIHHKTLKAQ